MSDHYEHHDQHQGYEPEATTTAPAVTTGQYEVLAAMVERVSKLNEFVASNNGAKIRFSVRDIAVLDHIADNGALPRSAVATLLAAYSSSSNGALTEARITSLLGRYEESGLVELLPGRVISGRWEGTWATLTKDGFRAIGREPTDSWRSFTRAANTYLSELQRLAETA